MSNATLLTLGRRGVWDVGMKITSLLKHVFPLNHARYSSLPVFGPVMEGFVEWLQSQGYTRRTIRGMSQGAYVIDHWLRRRRIASTAQITPEVLTAVDAYFRPRDDNTRWANQALHRFLCERHALPASKPAVLSPSQKEAWRYAAHLREVRGLAESTIVDHSRCVVRFLESIDFNRKQSALTQLKHCQIERFVQQMARTHDRHSLLHVTLTVRAFLRFEFSQGTLPHPLHEQIDTPRVYAGERLPCALTREQVRALLRSIDKRSPTGLRDFTMLYLVALYGLRRSDLVALRLDSIDWRNGVLHVKQAKTRQALSLPLTDEAGDVLARYLRKARPHSNRRELFLRSQAPERSPTPWAVNVILQSWLKRSGLELGHVSPHTLRHSLAVHFLRRGVSMKCIGDTLGHRNLTSTAQYLRLNVDDLRKAGLPVPKPASAVPLLTGDWHTRFPKVRAQAGPQPRSRPGFRSAFGKAIEQYIGTRRTLGCKYAKEVSALRGWDTFLYQQKVKTLNRECFCLWTKTNSHLTAKTQSNYWYCVRGFLAHYARQHPHCFVPDQTPFRRLSPARLPRLVSTEEMARLLATAAQLENRRSTPLRSHTVQIGLTLLFCCGLRAGELLRLQLRHYEVADQLLRIEETKFNKSRLVPLAPSVALALERYLEQRRHCGIPTKPESVLMWCGRLPEPKAAYALPSFTDIWKRLCVSAGVVDERGRPPRVHDLRHSFAVEALHRWYEQGVNVQSRLPHLAAYLGHTGPSSSHYYLHLTPTLRSVASQRFYRAFGGFTTTGGTL